MAERPKPIREPRSVLLARDLPPDPRALAALQLADFGPIARERMHPVSYDYVAGGSWDESSLLDNEAAWRRYRLRPRVLVDVSEVDPTTTLLGFPAAVPAAIAPMAAHGVAHPDAELATARGAAACGVPFILSTHSSCSIEQVAEAARDGTMFFQLYAQPQPRRSRQLVERAEAAGFKAIVLTVDLPVLGYRVDDLRNGWRFSLPRGNFAADRSAGAGRGQRPEGGWATLGVRTSRTLAWRDIADIRSWSSLPLVLKGILTAEDVRLAVEHGVDAIAVSNHGARQLDRVAAPIDVLEEVVAAAAGRAEVWVDGGVRSGLDVVVALALGARAVLVGRPILWALASSGQAGVERALTILRTELEVAMALLGTPRPGDITRAHVAR